MTIRRQSIQTKRRPVLGLVIVGILAAGIVGFLFSVSEPSCQQQDMQCISGMAAQMDKLTASIRKAQADQQQMIAEHGKKPRTQWTHDDKVNFNTLIIGMWDAADKYNRIRGEYNTLLDRAPVSGMTKYPVYKIVTRF